MSHFLSSRSLAGSGGMALFPVLVILAVCTNLRIGELPLGVGEVGLALLMAAVFFGRRHQLVTVARQFRPLLYFWGAFLAILVVAGGLSLLQDRLSRGAAHDVLAYAFSLSVGFLTLVLAHGSPQAGEQMGARMAVAGVLVAVLAFGLTVIDYLNGNAALSSALQANQWWRQRFNGWAADPNQWGFMLMVACMLALLALKGRVALLVFGVGLWLLLEVRSDAAIGGIVVFCVTYVGIALFRVPTARPLALMALALLVIVVGLFKTVGERHPPSLIPRMIGAVVDVPPPKASGKRGGMDAHPLYSGYNADKLEQRLSLWTHTLDAWRRSPVIGLGPGAYSGLSGPLQEMESHNLILQVLVNAGVLGVLAAASLLGWLLWRLWWSPQGALWIALVAGVLVQGMAQYMMRHPLFWVVVALAVWRAAGAGRPVGTDRATIAATESEGKECQSC